MRVLAFVFYLLVASLCLFGALVSGHTSLENMSPLTSTLLMLSIFGFTMLSLYSHGLSSTRRSDKYWARVFVAGCVGWFAVGVGAVALGWDATSPLISPSFWFGSAVAVAGLGFLTVKALRRTLKRRDRSSGEATSASLAPSFILPVPSAMSSPVLMPAATAPAVAFTPSETETSSPSDETEDEDEYAFLSELKELEASFIAQEWKHWDEINGF